VHAPGAGETGLVVTDARHVEGLRLQVEVTATVQDINQNRVATEVSDPGPVVTDPPLPPVPPASGGGASRRDLIKRFFSMRPSVT